MIGRLSAIEVRFGMGLSLPVSINRLAAELVLKGMRVCLGMGLAMLAFNYSAPQAVAGEIKSASGELKPKFAPMQQPKLAPIEKSASVGNSKTAGKQKPVKLIGQIDEFGYLTSSAGIRLSSSKMPARVEKISLGSSAAYSGMREGDKVTNVAIAGDNIMFTLERNGKVYSANVATDVDGVKAEFDHRKIKWTLGDAAFDKEIEKLTQTDMVVMIDRSASMLDNHAGVPGDQTKWSWVKQQIDNLYFSTARFFEHGFDIVTFNDKPTRWKSVSIWDLKQVFQRFKPEGERKDIGGPLREVLTDYSKARKPDSKPLLVIVMTDGVKNDGLPLQQVLVEASQEMTHQREVTVVFMQIGDSILANELFDDLDRNLLAKGAKYDIAEFKPFEELRNKGALWTMLSTLKTIEATGALPAKPAQTARHP